jgi:aldose 1-epimerase
MPHDPVHPPSTPQHPTPRHLTPGHRTPGHPTSRQPVVLSAGSVSVTVDPDDGARLCSLVVDGLELLHTDTGGGWTYGSFVMAPWAGRIRDGVAQGADRTLRFPRQDDDGHGLHGLVHSLPWTATGPTSWAIDLPRADDRHLRDGTVTEPAWLDPLRIEQHVQLHPDRLELILEVTAGTPVPVTVGWHPWFRRQLGGADARVELPASYMLTRDATGIATTERVEVPPAPWDDAFGGLHGPVAVQWGDVLRLELDHDGPVTVVFTGRDHAVCVEPQSGPPDEVNQRPRFVRPDEPLRLTSTWRWTRP